MGSASCLQLTIILYAVYEWSSYYKHESATHCDRSIRDNCYPPTVTPCMIGQFKTTITEQYFVHAALRTLFVYCTVRNIQHATTIGPQRASTWYGILGCTATGHSFIRSTEQTIQCRARHDADSFYNRLRFVPRSPTRSRKISLRLTRTRDGPASSAWDALTGDGKSL